MRPKRTIATPDTAMTVTRVHFIVTGPAATRCYIYARIRLQCRQVPIAFTSLRSASDAERRDRFKVAARSCDDCRSGAMPLTRFGMNCGRVPRQSRCPAAAWTMTWTTQQSGDAQWAHVCSLSMTEAMTLATCPRRQSQHDPISHVLRGDQSVTTTALNAPRKQRECLHRLLHER
jgi:hypothetical protein